MKNTLALYVLLLGSLAVQSQEYIEMIDAGTYSVEEIVTNAELYFADKEKGRGSGYKQFKRWEYNAMRLMNEEGYLTPIEENLSELESYNAYLNSTSENRQVLTDNWSELGPDDWNATSSWNPGVGRITSIAIDITDSNHIVVGANTGGVWDTRDGGLSWTPLGDYFSNLSVYSVVIDPSNSDNYFFGSNNGLIYKSTDSGATWNLIGDMGNSDVNKLLIHPTDSNIMFATAQYGGIRKSVDGGVNWTNPVSDSRGYDVEFKPGDPSIVYASGNGFHMSTDGGDTFVTITGFATDAKMIGVSPDDDSVVYVVEASGGSFGAFYSSNDSGISFTELDHIGRNYFGYDTAGFDSGGQAPRDMDVAVNPSDVNEVHIAGVLTWRSLDGGMSFTCTSDWVPGNASSANIGYCHADVDILEFDGTTLFAGTDGGIFKATDTGNLNSDYYEDITKGLGIRQFYKIGISQTEDVVVTGGSQDNGSSFYTAANGWEDWIGADGMEGFVDKDNTNTMYGMIQFGGMYRTTNSGTSITYLSSPDSGNWVTPFEQDPIVTNNIYLGLNYVYKSVNSGNNWTAISQNFGGYLNHLKIAPSNNLIMVAARSTILYRTTNGGFSDWEQISSPGGAINSVAIHPTNPDLIAVATTGAGKVYVSNDGGETWISYLYNLPSFSALALVWDDNGEDGLYLGMNYGVFYIDNTLSEWQPYSNNIPNVIINELEINSVDEKIYAGSYGRGLWSSPIVPHILSTTSFLSQDQVTLYPNPANTIVTLNLQKSVEADIRVFDVLGKLVIYQPDVSIANSHTINISELNDGIYFIRINSEIGTITKKLIKE